MNLYRLWFYFRTGHGAYLATGISLLQFLLVGAIYLQKFPGLTDLHLTDLAVVFLIPYGVVAVMVGWLHKRHQMQTDTQIAVLSNPYVFRIQPGKEEKISYPMTLFGLKIQRIWMEKYDLMTDDLRKEFDNFEVMLKRLMAGEEIR
jgi:hypothetical protein